MNGLESSMRRRHPTSSVPLCRQQKAEREERSDASGCGPGAPGERGVRVQDARGITCEEAGWAAGSARALPSERPTRRPASVAMWWTFPTMSAPTNMQQMKS